jgi:ATP-dependent exoDNAse (exonuclease V) beta subunit
VPRDLLARWLSPSRHLLGGMTAPFTREQILAIEHDGGELLLDASAGSGKTAVLVERFVRTVLEGGADVRSILAITFTDKAANELRERIRARLRDRGAEDAARATEGAHISTIHSLCAQLLRADALAFGLDPDFTVLDEHEAARLSRDAFDAALGQFAGGAQGGELIAAHGPAALRAAIVDVHDQLRSLGMRHPTLPLLPPADDPDAPEFRRALSNALRAAELVAAELGALVDPTARIEQALGALTQAQGLLAAGGCPWPGDLDALALPSEGGAAALRTEACDTYRQALTVLRAGCEHAYGAVMRTGLDQLLTAYARRYAELKRRQSALDFEDLELFALELLSRGDHGPRIAARFTHILVDELQDTNRVQFELIDRLADGELFTVGDAQQSIYGFRHADVGLFESRGRAVERDGGRLSLNTNFRSRPEILAALNGAFQGLLGERFRELQPGRQEPPCGEPLVELLIVDKGADWEMGGWESDGLAAPWRQAEARALAGRVRELTDGGVPFWEIVVLTRASTDLRIYERALEDAGVPTYLIGGSGYWSHPQVVQLLCYLRALANPLDEEALYGVWYSPICGVSLDALVLLAAGAPTELDPLDRERLESFERWFADERSRAAVLGPEELLARALERPGYVASVLALPGGRRRLANVRKLLRLARDFENDAGSDLRGFLELVSSRAQQSDRESEAPVESEALDAVRLMTIHRAKGLEFGVVCVADLGRAPVSRPPLIRISSDGERLGLRLARPGTGSRIPALDYKALGEEQAAAATAEERRLFYVAMTRARERLILSGAARMDTWARGNQGTPIDWITPAFVADVADDHRTRVTDRGVRVTFVQPEVGDPSSSDSASEHVAEAETVAAEACAGGRAPGLPVPQPAVPMTGEVPTASVSSLSYSSLELHERCGYRFYVERVLGVPSADEGAAQPGGGSRASSPAERGELVHALLERLNFRNPKAEPSWLEQLPAADAAAARELVERFGASDMCARLAAAADVRREQSFALVLADGLPLLTGTFDVLAREGRSRLLVVDYKSDRLVGDADPEQVFAERYELQRQTYALAALRTGAEVVEVVHLFLERPDTPAGRTFVSTDIPPLEQALGRRARAIMRREFPVAEEPYLALCTGCPAEGGLCSWPRALTRRPAPDRLF